MNFVFAGLHGTGKSTIAKAVAAHFGLTFYSTGMAFRDLAQAKGMNLEEFSLYSETHKEVDTELDNKILEMAKSGKDYAFDGQLPAYLLKDLVDYSILLKCDEKVRIGRMAERDGRSSDDQAQETYAREESERQRFIDLYQLDIAVPSRILSTYDLILNTTTTSIEDVLAVCIAAISTVRKSSSIWSRLGDEKRIELKKFKILATFLILEH